MKINPSVIIYGFAILAFALVASEAVKVKQDYFSKLHPAVQQAAHVYDSGISNARVGDFVTIRNLDNLESARTLIVTARVGNRIHLIGQDPLITSTKYWETKKQETMHLDRGSYEKVLRTYDVVFLHQNSNPVGWRQMACWYYGVTQG